MGGGGGAVSKNKRLFFNKLASPFFTVLETGSNSAVFGEGSAV